MIQLPRRSVTRFFIPLIDVLTLLFCIFLMMPAVKKSDEAEAAGPEDAAQEREAQRLGPGQALQGEQHGPRAHGYLPWTDRFTQTCGTSRNQPS